MNQEANVTVKQNWKFPNNLACTVTFGECFGWIPDLLRLPTVAWGFSGRDQNWLNHTNGSNFAWQNVLILLETTVSQRSRHLQFDLWIRYAQIAGFWWLPMVARSSALHLMFVFFLASFDRWGAVDKPWTSIAATDSSLVFHRNGCDTPLYFSKFKKLLVDGGCFNP